MSPALFESKKMQFRINSKNEHNPPRVHVVRGGAEAVIEINTSEVMFLEGFSRSALREIVEFVTQNRADFLEAWNEYFGKKD